MSTSAVARLAGAVRELDLVTREKLTGLLRAGNRLETTLRACGVSVATYADWARRGRLGEEPYAGLEVAVAEAVAMAEVDAVSSIHRAAKGYTKREVTTGQVVTKDGEVVDVTKTKTVREFDWHAAAFLAERANPEAWGKKDQVKHTGRVGPGPTVNVMVGADDALRALHARFGAQARPAPLTSTVDVVDQALASSPTRFVAVSVDGEASSASDEPPVGAWLEDASAAVDPLWGGVEDEPA